LLFTEEVESTGSDGRFTSSSAIVFGPSVSRTKKIKEKENTETSVADPYHFDTDPDPQIRTSLTNGSGS
jgi:hypothetical protein